MPLILRNSCGFQKSKYDMPLLIPLVLPTVSSFLCCFFAKILMVFKRIKLVSFLRITNIFKTLISYIYMYVYIGIATMRPHPDVLCGLCFSVTQLSIQDGLYQTRDLIIPERSVNTGLTKQPLIHQPGVCFWTDSSVE